MVGDIGNILDKGRTSLNIIEDQELMRKMAPTNGGQYHWASLLAHKSYQKVFSYVTGRPLNL